MRLVVFDGGRLGLVRGGGVVDVSDLVGGGHADWPPVFLLRTIARFPALRPRLEEALERRPPAPLDRVRLEARSSSRAR